MIKEPGIILNHTNLLTLNNAKLQSSYSTCASSGWQSDDAHVAVFLSVQLVSFFYKDGIGKT